MAGAGSASSHRSAWRSSSPIPCSWAAATRAENSRAGWGGHSARSRSRKSVATYLPSSSSTSIASIVGTLRLRLLVAATDEFDELWARGEFERPLMPGQPQFVGMLLSLAENLK